MLQHNICDCSGFTEE